jgi:hypothetical protein
MKGTFHRDPEDDESVKVMRYAIPTIICDLIASGIWPKDAKSAMAQNLQPLVSRERLRRFAPDEDHLYLYAPPFRTIADEVASSSPVVAERFWKALGALGQIIPEKALILGDFGQGSDAPIILDYSRDSLDPPVFRLRYSAGGRTDWVQAAANLAEFSAILGFIDGECGGR